MPSKNKKSGRGKTRKVGRSKKQKHLDAQMEHLMISGGDVCKAEDEDFLLDEAIKLAAAEKDALKGSTKTKGTKILSKRCHHGYVPTREQFITNDFSRDFLSELNSGRYVLTEVCIAAAHEVITEKYPDVWHDSSKLKMVVSMYLWQGTQHVLKGDIKSARLVAFSAYSLQRRLSVLCGDPPIALLTLPEMFHADEHTLVRYLRKSIPCSCLDEKYKEVKCITKLGFCCNELCSKPDRMAERRSMMRCTGCGDVNYCSRECQKAHWPAHKKTCGLDGDDKAESTKAEEKRAEAILELEYAEEKRRIEEEYINDIAKLKAEHDEQKLLRKKELQSRIARIARNSEVVERGQSTLIELQYQIQAWGIQQADIDRVKEEKDSLTLAQILAINLGSELKDLLKLYKQHLLDDAYVQFVDAKAADLRYLQWCIANNSLDELEHVLWPQSHNDIGADL
eukprot:CAMPEP_0201686002 /NCGR_PEP_ID=MMETSP0578-20130828/599_1 /ASSEMBLY_ACC=CAM_ASM_000663 /TAXON_ID=267565 /ORGANISM="Skeletonema grethea, Strain CCMP 1804" /LENGTH=451 /DNA_ID=CAMNT_0048169989 /DNA_START=47 /DNA_END=1402 /DNA_ORIENTATION=-